jgi:uncharacterized protein (TIGR03435 family)
MKSFGLIMLTMAIVGLPLLSQSQQLPKPSFEVVSIKPSMGALSRLAESPGGRFVATNEPLNVIIGYAYRSLNVTFTGGPNWIKSDLWDIEAKGVETSSPGPLDGNGPNAVTLMLQSLLEDRFQLKMHRESKEEPAYELTIAKGSPKLKLSEDQTPVGGTSARNPQPSGALRRGRLRLGLVGGIEASAIPLGTFTSVLAGPAGRRVVDKTGLTGLYDITLHWAPERVSAGIGANPTTASDPSGPSIFTAVEEQLGLKLIPGKTIVDMMVIDSAQKPSQN